MSNSVRFTHNIIMILSRRFFLSTLMATSCIAGININTPEFYETGTVKTAIEILESCYENRITPLGLAGNSTEVISKILWSRVSSAISLINVTPKIVNNNSFIDSKKQYKLQVFMVTSSSSIDLTMTLKKIKQSIWWNHMATFLILEWTSNNNCLNSQKMLWAAWEMNIINANLICHHKKKGPLIYTYNPYTSLAPFPWQVVKIYNEKNGHPWTLFSRRQKNLKGLCKNLHFEKTNNLGGYKINISVTDLTFSGKVEKNRKICVGDYEEMICQIIFPALNATPNVLLNSIKSAGYMDKNGKPHGILEKIINGQSDVALLGRYITSLTNVTITYPHWQSSLRIMTKYRGYKSQLSKIASVIDIKSRFCLIIICSIDVILFKYFLNQDIIAAFLSTFRMIISVCFLNENGKISTRIYLASLLLFSLTMHGIYEGKLSSLLTKQEPLKNVNTKKDLVALNYNVYGSTTYGIHFKNPEFDGRYFELEEIICTDYVLKNSRAACVGDIDFLIYDAVKFKLYLSTESLVETHMALPIRSDWPLENRVNTILRRSVETHWGDLLHDRIPGKALHALQVRDNELKNQGFRTLNLEQLNFAFVFLGIGLGLSSISFVFEALINFENRKERELHFYK